MNKTISDLIKLGETTNKTTNKMSGKNVADVSGKNIADVSGKTTNKTTG
jgi:hypothetical protein